MVVDKIPEAVVKDLIPLVNSLGNLPKTATVKYGATNFPYVPLDDIMAKIKADGNFAFMQPIGVSEDGRTCLQCVLYHKSGFPISSDAFPLPIKDGMKAQDVGAVLTYYRRYSASAFFGIASDEDNDGQAPEIASPKEKCEDCGRDIVGSHGLSPEKIVAGSMRAYHKKLCFDCSMKAKAAKEAEKKEEVK